MKFFIDTANTKDIKELSHLIDGVTTNPSLVSKEGKNFKELIMEITKIVDGPISVEATAIDVDGMVKEAEEYASWSDNIVIKIPMTEDGLKAVKKLKEKEIKTNVTLVFSVNQAIMAAKAGATYVSPFVGRLDDIGHSGMGIVEDIVDIYDTYDYETEVIVASIRHPQHVIEAARMGAHVVTIPPAIIEKMIKHPLTDKGLDKFLEDWKKVDK